MLLEKSKEETSNIPCNLHSLCPVIAEHAGNSLFPEEGLVFTSVPSLSFNSHHRQKKGRSFRWLLSVVWKGEEEEEEEGVQEVRALRCSGHSAAFPASLLIFGWNTEISPQLGRSVCNRGRGGKQEKYQKQPRLSSAVSFDCERRSSVFIICSSGVLLCVSALTNTLIHVRMGNTRVTLVDWPPCSICVDLCNNGNKATTAHGKIVKNSLPETEIKWN